MSSPGYDVFVSYSSANAEWVEAFHADLTAALNGRGERDYAVFLDRERLKPGYEWDARLQDAVLGSAVFVPVLSPRFFASEYCATELDLFAGRNIVLAAYLMTAPKNHRLAGFQHQSFFGNGKGDVAHPFERGSAEYRQAMATLADAILEMLRAPGVGPPANPRRLTYTQKLPTTDSTLIGRDGQLATLDEAWKNANFVQVIAPGGTGKTALMTKFYKGLLGRESVFGWSFYRQGTSENSKVSTDELWNAAVHEFQLRPEAETADAKAMALLDYLRRRRTLFILDGLEPLQDPATGELRDLALKDLLRMLADQNAGLVLCTTRKRLEDVPDDAPRAVSIDLEDLPPEDGARYLREKFGVVGTEEELRAASVAYGNHALALTLLGTWLRRMGGDVSRRFEIDELPTDDRRPGRHARRVMQSYAAMFEGKPEGDVLRGLGYFDRPAEREALRLVMRGALDEGALANLKEARLILSADGLAPIDCHPLVREHFGAVMRSGDAETWRAGHLRLYEYYCGKAPEKPDTVEAMSPLFHAVGHGCRAGRHQEVCDKVYFDRILRGQEFYLWKKLGAFGADLSLLAYFFESPWSRPVAVLSGTDQSWVLSEAAITLRALGRLDDSVDPMRAGAEAALEQQDWRNAAISYSSLSELLLTLGRVAEAIAAARQSVEYGDRSGDAFQRMGKRTTLGDALHQAGDLAEAERLFVEAEKLQEGQQRKISLLDSLGGYRYCDLLLGRGETAEVQRRATQTLAITQRHNLLLDIGLDHLSLGRAHAPGSAESRHHLDQAIDFLRRAGTLHRLPLALLARGTDRDLEEVHRIASRSGMRLHLTDYHLAMTRRHKSLEHLEKAERLIQETGYHRRDAEAAELREGLSDSKNPNC